MQSDEDRLTVNFAYLFLQISENVLGENPESIETLKQ